MARLTEDGWWALRRLERVGGEALFRRHTYQASGCEVCDENTMGKLVSSGVALVEKVGESVFGTITPAGRALLSERARGDGE